MESWLKVSLILCLYGVMKELRPSEPFITEFFLSPPMNFTMEQVTEKIYPLGVYSNLAELVLVFLVTDYVRYKPVLVASVLSALTVYIILVTCRTLFWAQVTQVFYGLFMAGDVAYFAYIYAKVEKEHFQEVTSHTRCAYLVGRMLSGVISQISISSGLFTYYQLQFLTIGGLSMALLGALALPRVENSIYFHRKTHNISSTSVESVTSDTHDLTTAYGGRGSARETTAKGGGEGGEEGREARCGRVLATMWHDVRFAFTNLYVVKMLLWSVMATAGFYQVLNYVQLLWKVVSSSRPGEDQALWNGAVETTHTLLGALGTFVVGRISLPWHIVGDYVLSVHTLAMAVLLFTMSQTDTLWVAYTTLIGFNVLYQVTITIVNFEIAKNLREDSYGLIFGVALFLSLSMQTLLTVTFVSSLQLPPRLQFISYGGYVSVLGVIFTVKAILGTAYRFCYRGKDLLSDPNVLSSRL